MYSIVFTLFVSQCLIGVFVQYAFPYFLTVQSVFFLHFSSFNFFLGFFLQSRMGFAVVSNCAGYISNCFLTVPDGFALIMKLIWPAVLSNQSINQSVQPTKSWQNNRSSHKTQPLLPVICGQIIIWNFLDIISFCVTVNLIWIYVSGRSILLTRSGSWGNNCFPYLNTVLCV